MVLDNGMLGDLLSRGKNVYKEFDRLYSTDQVCSFPQLLTEAEKKELYTLIERNEITVLKAYEISLKRRQLPLQTPQQEIQESNPANPYSIAELIKKQIDGVFEEYNQNVQEEYNSLKDLFIELKTYNENKVVTLDLYKQMRPRFVVEKEIRKPADELKKVGITDTWLGKAAIHKDMKEVINYIGTFFSPEEKKQIRKEDVAIGVSFAFRLNRPDQTRLSNHALGKAIDIKPGTNPYLKGAKLEAINHILQSEGKEKIYPLKVYLQQQYSLKEWYELMKNTSSGVVNFLNEHNENESLSLLDKWLQDPTREEASNKDNKTWHDYTIMQQFLVAWGVVTINPKTKKLDADKNGTLKVNAKNLISVRKISADGILTIPLKFFEAWNKSKEVNPRAGIGAEYGDLMHFEIKVP